jgi:hypothetical protein
MYFSIRFCKTVRRLPTDVRQAAGGAFPWARSVTAPQTMRSLGLALSLLLSCAAAAEADLTIMPLGGSTTWGGANGFDIRLYTDLQNAGYSFTFVGTSTDNPSPVLMAAGQTHHEGHPGYALNQIANNLDGNDGSPGNNGGFWFHKPAPPNVILLHGGGTASETACSFVKQAQGQARIIGSAS